MHVTIERTLNIHRVPIVIFERKKREIPRKKTGISFNTENRENKCTIHITKHKQWTVFRTR